MAKNLMDIICQKLLIFILLNGFIFEVSLSLRIVRFEVPSAVAKGQPVLLNCNYDLEGDELYSVKYYKDYVEFYRYLPTDEPNPGQRFALKGAYVNPSLSNATHAYLSYTDLNSDGMYACEVSTEGPSFSTIRSEGLMKVYALPQEKLRIEDKEVQYDVNDKINLICKSGDGRPLPDLSWYINDHRATKDQLITYPTKTNGEGLQSTKLGLVFLATPNYFSGGVLKLLCTGTLTLVYEFEAVEYVISGTAKNKTNNGPYSPTKDWLSKQTDNRETPTIKGVKQKYNVNDVLDVNCTGAANDAQLKWFVNEYEANSSLLVRYEREGKGNEVLGLRMTMEQYHFQMQELKLRCVALLHRTIADFQDHIIFRTLNQEVLEAQAANVGIHSTAENAKYRGLTYLTLLAPFLLLSMQYIYLEN